AAQPLPADPLGLTRRLSASLGAVRATGDECPWSCRITPARTSRRDVASAARCDRRVGSEAADSEQDELVVQALVRDFFDLAARDHAAEASDAGVLHHEERGLAAVAAEPLADLRVVEIDECGHAVAGVEVLALPVHLPRD